MKTTNREKRFILRLDYMRDIRARKKPVFYYEHETWWVTCYILGSHYHDWGSTVSEAWVKVNVEAREDLLRGEEL